MPELAHRIAVTASGALALALVAAALPLPAAGALAELGDLSKVDAGASNACALTASGAVKCWGDNRSGQLGDGGTRSRNFAGDVAGLSSGAVDVAVGKNGSHACAIVPGGGVRCWGANESGQLGDGTTTMRLAPVDVTGLPAAAVALAAGGKHTCAILAGGALRCWGANESGQLGDGTTTAKPVPTDVTGLASGVAFVSAGPAHTCAVTTGGAAKCWGANQTGQLGDGSTTDRFAPVDVSGLASGVAQVSAGGAPVYGNSTSPIFGLPLTGGGHTCAVLVAGGVKCWGANDSGQLGDGTTTERHLPVDVGGLPGRATSIATGGVVQARSIYNLFYSHSCATTEGGAAFCWGTHHCGELGNGEPAQCSVFDQTNRNSTVPVGVSGLSAGTTHLSAGNGFNCAVTVGSRARCWGTGWLGSGGVVSTGAPRTVSIPVLAGTEPQHILLGALAPVPVGQSRSLPATGGASGNPVVFTSLTPATCLVSGASVTGVSPGTCTIAANQAGDATFEPAPTVTVDLRSGDPVPQTITWGGVPSLVVGGAAALQVSASSGLPVFVFTESPGTCSVGWNSVRGLAPGTCLLTAIAGGNAIYGGAAPAQAVFLVTTGTADAHALLVQKVGSHGVSSSPAQGTITSSPPGIDCGEGGVCQAAFATGSLVSLTPNPAPGARFFGWEGACSGRGPCTVRMDGFTNVRAEFGRADEIPRLVNIATRATALTGDEVLIGGFVIGGASPKTVVVRARGPSLAAFGIAGSLANPRLDLYAGQALVAANDDWASAANAPAIQSTGFAPPDGLEAAVLATLSPGAYTAVVSGANGSTGIAIVEVFEVDLPEVPLANISTRGSVLTGNDVMIGGFVIQGDQPQTVIVRARGPSLAGFGVPGVLADPVLQLFAGSTVIASNDDWQTSPDAAVIQSSGFAPSDARESVIRITLNPGAYTAIVSGKNGATGVGIIEVFALP